MQKLYESNGNKSENPFEVKLVKDDGTLEDYYTISGEVREKITLADLVNEQVRAVKENTDAENSSGDYAQIGSSGDYARIGSSGDYAQIGSSGDSARIEIDGNNGVGFACGYKSAIKSKNGTWISLCEWDKNENGKYIPVFALSAQIGNEDYRDCNGKVLSEDYHYILSGRQFTPVILDDGLMLQILHSKKMDGAEIIKCTEIGKREEIYCVRKNGLSAHGNTLHEAMSDLTFKELRNKDNSEIVANIKECGYVTRADYRAITGACQFGTESFCKEHGYTDVERVDLLELLSKLDDGYFGAREFKELFE